jgi:hypothetical protein
MKWSQLSSAQRAFVQANAQYERDVFKGGKLIRRGAPKGSRFDTFALEQTKGCAQAIVGETARLVERDADRLRDQRNKAEARALIASYNGVITKLPDGKARNAGYLNRKSARALPMGAGINGTL